MESKDLAYGPSPNGHSRFPLTAEQYCALPDAELWEAFKEGEKGAFDLIYERMFDPLCGYGDKICADKALVEDVIQDLFIYLWTRRAFLGNTDSIKFYLFRSLRRRLIRQMTQEGKNMPASSLSADFVLRLADTVSVMPVSDEELERKRVLAIALAKLTDRQREAIYLKFYNNLSFQEVASVMEIEVRSVYNLIGRTIDSLRGEFKKKGLSNEITPTLIILILTAYLENLQSY